MITHWNVGHSYTMCGQLRGLRVHGVDTWPEFIEYYRSHEHGTCLACLRPLRSYKAFSLDILGAITQRQEVGWEQQDVHPATLSANLGT